MEVEDRTGSRINRREAIRRTAVAAGVAWTTPVIMSVNAPAFAQYGVPCETGCNYVLHLEPAPDLECTSCEAICQGNCGTCAGDPCARLTSVTRQAVDTIRFCTDCTLDGGGGTFCEFCPEEPAGSDCVCGTWSIDPSDPRCGLVPYFFILNPDCLERVETEVYFSCVQC